MTSPRQRVPPARTPCEGSDLGWETVLAAADLPALELGPLITAARAGELREKVDAALRHGAVPPHRGALDPARFLDGQDTSAHAAPTTLLAPPGASWKGAFVGRELLVHAVTQGAPGEELFGNVPGYHRHPVA